MYKLEDCEVYLYYLANEHVAHWQVGSVLGERRGMLIAQDDAQFPTMVLGWRAYDRDTGLWEVDEGADVYCSCRGIMIYIM